MKKQQGKLKENAKIARDSFVNRFYRIFSKLSHQEKQRSRAFDIFCCILIVISFLQTSMYLYFPSVKKIETFQNKMFSFNKFHEPFLYCANIQLYWFEYLVPEIFYPNQFKILNSYSSSTSSRILNNIEINQSNKARLLSSKYSQSDFGFYNENQNSGSNSTNTQSVKTNNGGYYDVLTRQLIVQTIILGLFLSLIFLIVYRQVGSKRQQNEDYISKSNVYANIFLYYFFQTYNYVTVIPLLQTILLSGQFNNQIDITTDNQETSIQIIIQVFTVLNLIFTLLLSFLIIRFSEQSLSMESQGLIRLNRSFLYDLQIIIKIAQTFIFCLLQSEEDKIQNTAKYLQLLFISFYLLLVFIDAKFYFPFSCQIIIETLLLCFSVGVTSLILYIFWIPFDVLSDQMNNVLLLVLSFLNSKFFLVRRRKFINHLMGCNTEDLKQDKNQKYFIYYKISLLLSEIDSLCKNEKDNFLICSLFQNHFKNCQKMYCFCQNFTSSYEQSNEPQKHKYLKLTYSQSFYQAYMYDLLEQFKKLLQLNNGEDQLFYCHYAMALCELDRYSKSLQQLFFLNDQLVKFKLDNGVNINNLINLSLPILMSQNHVTKEEEDVKISTQKFQIIQQKTDNIKIQLVTALKNKLALLDKIVKNNYANNENFFQDAKVLTEQLDKLQIEVTKFYHQYPLQDQKIMLSFFLSEIRNDLYGAQIINKQVCMEDEIFMRVLRLSKINFFSESVCLLKIGFGSEKGKLNWYSKNASSLLMVSEGTLKYCTHINELIPKPISNYHTQIVQNFLKTGKSKSFRKLSKMYFKDKLGYAQECMIFFDIDSLQQNDLSIIIFLKPIKIYQSSVSLFFDFEGNLLNSTLNIWVNFHYKEESIEFEKSFFYNLNWKNIFPNYQEYIQVSNPNERGYNKFFKVKMFLPKDGQTQSSYRNQQSSNQQKVSKSLTQDSYRNQSTKLIKGYIEYEVIITVHYQPYINKSNGRQERYYIFEVDDIKKTRDDSTAGNSTSYTKLDSSFKTTTLDNMSITSGIKGASLHENEHKSDDQVDIKKQSIHLKSTEIGSDTVNSNSLKNTNAENQQNGHQLKINTQGLQGINGLDKQSPTFKKQGSSDIMNILQLNQNKDIFSPSKANHSTILTFNNINNSELNNQDLNPVRDKRVTSLFGQTNSQMKAIKSSSISEDNQNLDVIQEHIDTKSPRNTNQINQMELQNFEEFFQQNLYNVPQNQQSRLDHNAIVAEPVNQYFVSEQMYELNRENQKNYDSSILDGKNNIDLSKYDMSKLESKNNYEISRLDLKNNQDMSKLLDLKDNNEISKYDFKNNYELVDLKNNYDISKSDIKNNFDVSNYDLSIQNNINKYQETDYKELLMQNIVKSKDNKQEVVIDKNSNQNNPSRNKQFQYQEQTSVAQYYENSSNQQTQNLFDNLESGQFYDKALSFQKSQSFQQQQLKQASSAVQLNQLEQTNKRQSQQQFYENESEDSNEENNDGYNEIQINRELPQNSFQYGMNSPTVAQQYQFYSPRDINYQIIQLSAKNLMSPLSDDTGIPNSYSTMPFSQNQLVSPKSSSFHLQGRVEKIEECVTEENAENDSQKRRNILSQNGDFNQKLFQQKKIKSFYYDKSQSHKKRQTKKQKFQDRMEITSTNQPNFDEKEEELNKMKNNYQNSVATSNKLGRYQYLQKYQKLHYFMESKSKPKSLTYFLLLRVIELIVAIVMITSFSIYIKTLIDDHSSKVEILKYQSEFLGPIDQGFGSIWQGVNYYFQMASQQRDYPSYKKRINFISANLNQTYINLKTFSEKEQINPVILTFLNEENYIFQPDGYRNVNIVLQPNRLIIYQLVKAFKQISNWNWDLLLNVSVYDFDIGVLNANIMKFTNLFSSVSQKMMSSLKDEVNNQNYNILVILISMMLVFSFLSAISTAYYVNYLKLKEALVELFRYMDKVWIDKEIERAKQSLFSIETNNSLNFLEGYRFSLDEKDTYLCNMEDKKNSLLKQYKQLNQNKAFSITYKRFVNRIFIFFIYLLFVVGTTGCMIGVYIYNTQYINSYVSACQTYQEFADSHSTVSRLTGLSEYYYSISAGWFLYMDNKNITNDIGQYDSLLLKSKNFVSNQLQNSLDSSQNKNTQNFQNFILSLENQNLCTNILNMQEFNLELCQSIQQGTMQRGLVTTFTKLFTEIQAERIQNSFNITLRNPRYPDGDHLEAGIMCTRILKYAGDLLNDDIIAMIDNAWKTILTMTVIYMMFIFILNITLLLFGYYYFTQDFKNTKRCLLLLPLNTLILENAFNSNLRILYLQNNLMDVQ